MSSVHRGGDPLGHLLAIKGTAADAQERAQLRFLAQDVLHVTRETLTLACVAQVSRPGRETCDAGRRDANAAHQAGRREKQRYLVAARLGGCA